MTPRYGRPEAKGAEMMQWKRAMFVGVLACAVLGALSGSVQASQPLWGSREVARVE
jgi:hypothetical protein